MIKSSKKSVIKFALCLPVLCFIGKEAIFAEEQDIHKKMSVAVVEFQIKGNLGIKDAGAIIAEWMISALVKTEKFDLKERVLLAKVLEEQTFQTSGMVNEKTIAAKVGELYGVQSIVTGGVMKWEEITSVTARLIDTKTGSILKAADVKAQDVTQIPEMINELALVLSGKQRTVSSEAAKPVSKRLILGTWRWFNGRTVIFKPDGNIYDRGKFAGTWASSESSFTLEWEGGKWVDTLILSENGRMLTGWNQHGARVSGVKISSSLD